MRKNILILFCIVTLLMNSCGSTKSNPSKQLYGPVWELDYISGPRIAFEGLFPDRKPEISFDKGTNQVSGNAGCNGYAAPYTLTANHISFGEPAPTTMMFCGEGEGQFLNMMQKVDGYRFDANGKLQLLFGDVPVLRFKKMD